MATGTSVASSSASAPGVYTWKRARSSKKMG